MEDILKINLSFDNVIVDKLVWTGSVNSDLSFKEACNYIRRGHIEPS